MNENINLSFLLSLSLYSLTPYNDKHYAEIVSKVPAFQSKPLAKPAPIWSKLSWGKPGSFWIPFQYLDQVAGLLLNGTPQWDL